MSHFYGEMKGNRGESTRCGSKDSGIRAHIRGWNVGIRVLCYYDEELGKDVCKVWETSGSNSMKQDKFIGSYYEK